MARESSKSDRTRTASKAATGRAKIKSAVATKTRRRERRVDWRETKKARLTRRRGSV
jgi:hypothetical protein